MPAPTRPAPEGALFVTFEGGEGSGKSTQVARLRSRLLVRGRAVLATREPGGSPRAEEIRSVLLGGAAASHGPAAEALLFAAARADHLARTIRPALAEGKVVLCDRFLDSTRVYQGERLPGDLLAALERVCLGGTMPDLTLILDLPAAVGLERATARRTARRETVDRFEAEDLAVHDRLRAAYLALAAAEPGRCAVIDASGSPDAVAAGVWAAIAPRLGATGLAR